MGDYQGPDHKHHHKDHGDDCGCGCHDGGHRRRHHRPPPFWILSSPHRGHREHRGGRR
jgi:hypothetical protein